MGDSFYCTAFAHIALVVSSLWSLRSLRKYEVHPERSQWAFIAFVIHLLYSMIGVFRYGESFLLNLI